MTNTPPNASTHPTLEYQSKRPRKPHSRIPYAFAVIPAWIGVVVMLAVIRDAFNYYYAMSRFPRFFDTQNILIFAFTFFFLASATYFTFRIVCPPHMKSIENTLSRKILDLLIPH